MKRSKDTIEKKDEETLLKLIAEVLDGDLDEEGRRALNALLKRNESARHYYRGQMELHARLHLDYTANLSLEDMPALDGVQSIQEPPNRTSAMMGRLRPVWLALAACWALFATICWMQRDDSGGAERLTQLPTFATIQEVRSARWESGSLPTESGARLGVGTMRLSEGLITLQFDSGAIVNLEAPSVLTMIDEMTVQLDEGTVLADIPESAIGFRIVTKSANVVDFGTRFSVSVDPETAETRTQVYDGLVEVHSPLSEEYVSLKAGQHHSAERDQFGEALDGLSEANLCSVDSVSKSIPNSVQLETSQDSYIGRVAGHESKHLLYVKHGYHRLSPHRKAYLGFDLSSLKGDQIQQAELTLHFSPSGRGLASHVPDATFSVYGLLSPKATWDEQALNITNAPANIPGKGCELVRSDVRKLGSFMIEQGRQRGAFGISGETLLNFLQERAGHTITLIVVRDTVETEDAGLVHGFASRRHPILPAPTLSLLLTTKE